MTATPSGGESRVSGAAGSAPASDGLHGPSLLTASPLRPRPDRSVHTDGQGKSGRGESDNERSGRRSSADRFLTLPREDQP